MKTIHFLFFLFLLPFIFATPEDPALTFEHLYKYGKNEYTMENWGDCVAFVLRAIEDFVYYRDETLWCREKCGRQIPDGFSEEAFKLDSYILQLSLMFSQSQKALCLLRYGIKKFGAPVD